MAVVKKGGKFTIVIIYGLSVGAVTAFGLIVYGVVVIGLGGLIEVTRSSLQA